MTQVPHSGLVTDNYGQTSWSLKTQFLKLFIRSDYQSNTINEVEAMFSGW